MKTKRKPRVWHKWANADGDSIGVIDDEDSKRRLAKAYPDVVWFRVEIREVLPKPSSIASVNGAAASARRLKLDVDRRSRSTDCYAACFFGGRTR